MRDRARRAVPTSPPAASPLETLTSLAILKVNFDQQGYDFIDNFVPFVVDVLRRAERGGATSLAVMEVLRAEYGIGIPEGAVTSVLRRAARKGLAEARGHGVYALTAAGERAPDLAAERVAAARDQQALVSRLVHFSGEHLEHEWPPDVAESALIRLASARGARVLAARGALVDSAPAAEAPDEDHLVGEFVLHLRDQDREGWGYLEALIKGALLASAMYYPDLGRIGSRFERLEVLLDTRLVLRALGTAGPEHEAAVRELLDLMYELGASLGIFDTTFGEVRNVLAAASSALRQPRRLRENWGESLEYMASQGYRSSDVELIIAQLERRLRALRISIRDRPPYSDRVGVDEAGLEQRLREGTSTRRPYPEDALRHDVSALTAVHRIRGGTQQLVLETSRAVFLTTNALLARTSSDFFREHYGADTVPLCYVDHQFATLAWLKKPTAAPALPMLQVMADSYAALNPPDGLWRAYLAEIARLETQGDISAEDYYSLRFTMAAKTALVDLVEPGENVDGSVPEILARTRAAIRAEVEATLAREGPAAITTSADDAPVDLATLRADVERDRSRREANLHTYAAWMGRLAARGVLVGGSLLVAVAAYLGVASMLPELPALAGLDGLRPLVWIAGFCILVLTAANLLFGTSVQSVSRTVEVRVTRRVDQTLQARFL